MVGLVFIYVTSESLFLLQIKLQQARCILTQMKAAVVCFSFRE